MGKIPESGARAGGSSFLFMSLHFSSRFKYVNYPLALAAGVCAPRLSGRGALNAFLTLAPHPQ